MNRPPEQSKHPVETTQGIQEWTKQSSERQRHANETGSSIKNVGIDSSHWQIETNFNHAHRVQSSLDVIDCKAEERKMHEY